MPQEILHWILYQTFLPLQLNSNGFFTLSLIFSSQPLPLFHGKGISSVMLGFKHKYIPFCFAFYAVRQYGFCKHKHPRIQNTTPQFGLFLKRLKPWESTLNFHEEYWKQWPVCWTWQDVHFVAWRIRCSSCSTLSHVVPI